MLLWFKKLAMVEADWRHCRLDLTSERMNFHKGAAFCRLSGWLASLHFGSGWRGCIWTVSMVSLAEQDNSILKMMQGSRACGELDGYLVISSGRHGMIPNTRNVVQVWGVDRCVWVHQLVRDVLVMGGWFKLHLQTCRCGRRGEYRTLPGVDCLFLLRSADTHDSWHRLSCEFLDIVFP